MDNFLYEFNMMFKEIFFVDVRVIKVILKGLIFFIILKVFFRCFVKKFKENIIFSFIVFIGSFIVDIYDG